MAGLRGNLATIKAFKQNLSAVPITLAHDVAGKAAPDLTSAARSAFDGGQNVYGDARPAAHRDLRGLRGKSLAAALDVNGQPLSLEASGATRAGLRFESIGTIVRCVLPTRWAQYLIGKYQILPQGAMPTDWQRRLGEILAAAKVKL